MCLSESRDTVRRPIAAFMEGPVGAGQENCVEAQGYRRLDVLSLPY